MSEHPQPFLPKTEEIPAADLDRAIHESREPVLPKLERPTPTTRSRVSRVEKLLGAAALALGGLVSREVVQNHLRTDPVTQQEDDVTVVENGMSEDELVRAAAAHHRVQVWRSYIKRLDAGERFPTTIDPDEDVSMTRPWRRFEHAETNLLMDIGPEFREEVIRRAEKAARMLVLQPQTPKTAGEVTRALDQAVESVVRSAAVVAQGQGWKGLNLMRADSIAMRVISKALRTSIDDYPEAQSRAFAPLFEALRERAFEKQEVERSAPDSLRADRDAITGVTVPNALAETETLPDAIFLDQFAWLGRTGGDQARLEYLRHDSRAMRILANNGFLPWIERSAPLIRRDPVFTRRAASALRRALSYDELTPEQSTRVARVIRVLELSS